MTVAADVPLANHSTAAATMHAVAMHATAVHAVATHAAGVVHASAAGAARIRRLAVAMHATAAVHASAAGAARIRHLAVVMPAVLVVPAAVAIRAVAPGLVGPTGRRKRTDPGGIIAPSAVGLASLDRPESTQTEKQRD